MPIDATEKVYQRIFEATSSGLILSDLNTGVVVEANSATWTLHGYLRETFIGQPATAYIAPHDYIQFQRWIQSAQAGNDFAGIIDHTRLDGSAFTAEVQGTTCHDGDRRYLLYTFHDISARLQTEQLLRQQSENWTHEQSALLQISQTLASDLELEPDLILDQLRIIIPYQHAVLFSLEESELAALAVRGVSLGANLKVPFYLKPNNTADLELLLNHPYSQRIGDVWSNEAPAQFLYDLLHDQAAILLKGIHSWMWLPLAVKGSIIGIIGVAHREVHAFTTHQANIALTVANQAAIAMANAQLYEQAQALATMQERQRLAQNLHDAVNQSLFSAGLIAEVLPRLWEKNPEEGRKSLMDIRRLTRGALAEMRGLLAELQPKVLIDSELSDLVHQLANAFIGRTNLPITVNVPGKGCLHAHGEIPAKVQVAFYYLCQEALTNVAKHANADQVSIDLMYDNRTLEMRIDDDGGGFDLTGIPAGHYGLGMMQERAEAVHIKLSITSQIGQGSEIVAHWKPT